MLLEEDEGPALFVHRPLGETLAPYSCYATMIMYGPLTQDAIRHLAAAYETITVLKQHVPPSLLWSFSPICGGEGCVVRVAAKETEDVRSWLGRALKDFESILGVDVYKRAFA